jgi:hypothetical protein
MHGRQNYVTLAGNVGSDRAENDGSRRFSCEFDRPAPSELARFERKFVDIQPSECSAVTGSSMDIVPSLPPR